MEGRRGQPARRASPTAASGPGTGAGGQGSQMRTRSPDPSWAPHDGSSAASHRPSCLWTTVQGSSRPRNRDRQGQPCPDPESEVWGQPLLLAPLASRTARPVGTARHASLQALPLPSPSPAGFAPGAGGTRSHTALRSGASGPCSAGESERTCGWEGPARAQLTSLTVTTWTGAV